MTDQVELRSSVPVIPVASADEAIAFYCDQLGFVVDFEVEDYAGVRRDAVLLHLDGVINSAAGEVTCRVETRGVDALFAEMEPRGIIDPDEPIHTMPWGSRQFSVRDSCGNRITFVQSA
jgi:uncharacterized glyoxalase superfamily protein PhnB